MCSWQRVVLAAGALEVVPVEDLAFESNQVGAVDRLLAATARELAFCRRLLARVAVLAQRAGDS